MRGAGDFAGQSGDNIMYRAAALLAAIAIVAGIIGFGRFGDSEAGNLLLLFYCAAGAAIAAAFIGYAQRRAP
jgi:hypothetical protein